MGLWPWTKRKRVEAVGQLMLVRARFDAAQTTPDNRKHWSNADALSADAAANPEARRTLRNRARYEVANNSYARGIVLTLANDAIGTGPRLQMLLGDPSTSSGPGGQDAGANRTIEAEFARWAKAVGLPEKLRTMRQARAQDGEGFALLHSNGNLDNPVKLDLRLIEADQIATPGAKLGIQWARCHDMLQHTWWTRIQPDRPDQWNWMDDTQKSLDQMGFSTLGEFLWTPRWASAKAGDARPQAPPDEAAFARYVANTVSHYGKSIHHWEVWNEPFFSGFWGGTAEEYAKLLQIAYREAKKADPGCFVLGGGGVDLGNMGWIEKLVRSLPGKSMDGCSIHYLEPEMAAEQLGRLRALLKERGMEVPIWNTEASVPTSSFLDQSRLEAMEPEARYHFRNACHELVRMYMENIANGVQRVFYYYQADPWRSQEFAKPRVLPHAPLGAGMWDEGRMLKPIAAAHAALALALEGKTYKSRTSVGELRAFFFQGKDSAAAVQYAAFKKFGACATVRLALPEGAQEGDFAVVDFMGNESAPVSDRGHIILPLSREPVYLICRRPSGADVLQRMYAGASLSAPGSQPN